MFSLSKTICEVIVLSDMNNVLPLVTVITIVYNGDEFLEQAMLSVLEQDYKNIEYIVIDGGSSDGSVDIIKRHSASLSYWESKKDSGIYNAWNKGLALSNGQVIGFLNADDWYEKGAIKKVVANYLNFGEKFVYFGSMSLRSKDGRFMYCKSSDFNLLSRRMSGSHPTAFLSKDIYSERIFDESYRICGDYEYFLFLSQKKKLNIVNDSSIVTNMRVGGVSDDFKSTLKVLLEDHKARRTHLPFSLAYISFFKDLLIKLPKKLVKNLLLQCKAEALLNAYYSKKKF